MDMNETTDLIKSVTDMTATVAGKIGEIDRRVSEAVQEVPTKIRQQFDVVFYVNTETGNDSHDGLSQSSALKTVSSAVSGTRSPAGARVKVVMMTDSVIDYDINFVNKHLFIDNRSRKMLFKSRSMTDTAGNLVGLGIFRLQGRGQNSSLVILGGQVSTDDCISTGNGDQWFYNNARTMIGMGGIDYDSGFFPVVLNAVSVTLGKDVVALASGGNGVTVYPGQGVVCATLYNATIDQSAEGAASFGYGVHFRNNDMYDANGNVLATAAVSL